jgi:glyoxylase-like metal-dependent hydrolase (beta-lactamase superfamily II)
VAGKGAFDQAVTFTESYWRAVAEKWVRRYPEAAADASASRVVLPEIIFSDQLIVLKGGEELVLDEVQGAAPGSAWVHLVDQDVLFAGDTVVAETHPWVSAAPDTRAWMDTLSSLRRPRYAETKIVPGRGPVCTSSATEPLSEYLALMRRRIRSLHRSERSRGEIPALVAEFLDFFPVPDGERETIQRRVRADLEWVFDELQENDE